MMSHLPSDLLQDVFRRLPIKSMREFRSVCKYWNTFSKDVSFIKKSLAQVKAAAEGSEFMVVMVISGQVHLMSTNLHGIHRNQGKLARHIYPDRLYISKVYHCDGLLLCTMKSSKRFVVWNPYSSQARWFQCQPRRGLAMYAIGYDNSKSCRTYKILRYHYSPVLTNMVWYKLFYINSTDSDIQCTISAYLKIWSDDRGVSLKGNTYWIATIEDIPSYLICFDFTTERFGRCLHLPFIPYFSDDIVTLSNVRDEQLAVLFRPKYTSHMEIWITTRIGPKVVSWRKLFIASVMEPLSSYQFRVPVKFFVDEEKKVAVVFDSDSKIGRVGSYIIGENGYFKEVDFEEPLYQLAYPSMCSYVPSLGKIN